MNSSSEDANVPETPFMVGDRITLKKKHPCGGLDWVVYRIGADIRMKCLTCERRIMLSRKEAERRTAVRVEGGASGVELGSGEPQSDEE
ncbi:DUF951 domain-containing protein [Dehalococcoides mccartyi]|nr:DUF951 domain-containing protein [Dehalococcoides mccartyi]